MSELMDEVRSVLIDESKPPVMDHKVNKTKKVGLNVTLNLPVDFTPGRCDLCPIHTIEYEKGVFEGESVIRCPLDYTNVTCPMTIRKEI